MGLASQPLKMYFVLLLGVLKKRQHIALMLVLQRGVDSDCAGLPAEPADSSTDGSMETTEVCRQ